jgi:propanol-preferring alcohol dehydrogenase
VHATRTIAEIRVGETVLIYGAGGVGLAVMQLCKISGARTIVVDRVPDKLQLAKGLGADEVVEAGQEDVAAAIHRITGGEGVDAAFELVGIEATIQNSLKALGKRGRLVFIGYSRDNLTVSPLQLVIGEQQIRASVGNTLQELVDVVRLAQRGKIKAVVSDVCALEEVNEMLDRLAQGQVLGRAVFRP